MKISFKLLILAYSLFFVSQNALAQNTGKTFTNPLLPSGADPFSLYKDGYYYYTNSTQDRLIIWKTKNLADLATAESKTVWIPPSGTSYSKELWAPEIHFINDKWYMYFAADDGKNDNHRMYVIENSSADPMKGEWIFKGQVKTPEDKWAIDGDIFENNDQYYMIWSGWEADINGQQNIYIAKMDNPWTISGKRTKISGSDFDWEKHGDLHDKNNPPHVNVNEGPQFLKNKDKVFIIYSASGCWTDFYALGMLQASSSGDLMNVSSWKNHLSRFSKWLPKIKCLRQVIILFSNHRTEKKTGFCIMPMKKQARDVAGSGLHAPKNLHGMKMELQISVRR